MKHDFFYDTQYHCKLVYCLLEMHLFYKSLLAKLRAVLHLHAKRPFLLWVGIFSLGSTKTIRLINLKLREGRTDDLERERDTGNFQIPVI